MILPEALKEKFMTWVDQHPRPVLALAILYLVCPIDLIPEAFVGFLGYIDDLLVMLLPFLIRRYLKKKPPRPK